MLPDTSPLPDLYEAENDRKLELHSPSSALWIAILLVGIAGNAGIALSPLLLSGMAQFLHFDDRLLGELAAAASVGSSLTTVGAIFFMDRKGWPLRLTAIVALCMYAVINLVIPAFFGNALMLQLAMLVGGCCSGLVWSAAATALTTIRNNERLIAIFYGTPYLTGLVIQPLMPTVFGAWGVGGAYIGIAGGCAVALLAMRAFPVRAKGAVDQALANAPDATLTRVSRGRVGIVMFALLLQYIANSGLWVYFDRIGHVAGHDAQTSANVIALGSGMALAGTGLATVFTARLRPLPTIIVLSAAMALVTLGLLEAKSYSIFAVSVSLFNAMITFITPFFFILLSSISTSPGRAALGANICMMGGFALGPLAVGYLAENADFTGAIAATAATFLVSGLLVFAGVVRGAVTRGPLTGTS